MSMRIRYLAWTTVWAALVLASIVLMLVGLWRRIFFGYTAIPEFVEDLRAGNQFILAGSLASLGAAALTLVQRYPRWVSVCVAASAVLIGGVALMGPPNLAPHFVALFVLPAAFAGLLGGVLRSGVTPRYAPHGVCIAAAFVGGHFITVRSRVPVMPNIRGAWLRELRDDVVNATLVAILQNKGVALDRGTVTAGRRGWDSITTAAKAVDALQG